jgi:hypothetical protein
MKGNQAVTEFIDRTSTAYFSKSCDILVENGWSIYPQTVETREPESILGRPIRPFIEYGLDDHPPTRRDLDLWRRYVPSANVAGVMGRGSRYAVAIDIDITDRDLARRMMSLAQDVLGKTPLMRVGQEPKIALIYKNQNGAIQNLSPKAETGGHGIDILAKTKALTFLGIHHRTGRGFRWIGEGSPLSVRPDDLPEISADLVRLFLDEANLIMPFAQSASGMASGFTPDWHENSEGKIDDGREKYLFDLVVRTVGDAHHQGDDLRSPQVVSRLMTQIYNEFAAHAVMDGRWAGASLAREIASRVARQCSRITSGAYTPSRGRTATIRRAPQVEQEFSPTGLVETKKTSDLSANSPPTQAGHDERLKMAQASMAQAVQAFLDQSTAFIHAGSLTREPLGQDEEGCDGYEQRIRIIKAPPGMGKTSTVLRMIAQDPNTYLDGVDGDGNRVRAPYIMLVPTYRNIDELRVRATMFGLDARASDFELERTALAFGLIKEDTAADVIAQIIEDIRAYAGPGQEYGGFRVAMYQGRVRAGCAMHEQMSLAMSMGAGGSALCRAQVYDKEAQERVEEVCQYFAGCPAIQQRGIFDTAHLVLMPHAFAGLTIPNEAKNTRGVIIDERIFDLFIHTTFFDVDILKLPRKAPRPSKKERDVDDFDHQAWQDGLNALRRQAVEVVHQAIREKRDIAEMFLSLPAHESSAMLSACRRLSAASMQRADMLRPNMDVEDVRKIASIPTGFAAREEWRFWTLIADRLPIIVNMSLDGEDIQPDARIQVLFLEEDGSRKIRISWRSTPNWIGKPLLLIDASAAPDIIAKVWQTPLDQIEIIDLVEMAGLYDRISTVMIAPGAIRETFLPKSLSNYSIVGPSTDSVQRLSCASLLAKIRHTISAIAAKHADGRVLVGATIAARRAITQSWTCPHNVDFGHFGALRGIDAFKHHVAAISIGRLEIPPDVLDGLAAALTYDDDAPEKPMNWTGTGYYEGQPIRMATANRTLKFRDGSGDCTIPYPVHPGTWGRLVQAQYREEEMVQFLGRLRPFYRNGARPTWYCLSNIVNDGVILDDVLTTGALIDQVGLEMADTSRRAQGVLTPQSLSKADPYAPLATITRCIEKAAAIGDFVWKPVKTSGGTGFIAKSVDMSPSPPDQLDAKIGTPQARLIRENRLIRYVVSENYVKGWVALGDFAFSRRLQKVTPRQWRDVAARSGGIPKLDFYELVALAGLNLMHNGEAHKLDPFSAIDQNTRNFDHYGEWTSVADI